MKVSYNDIEDAFLYVASAQPFVNSAILDKSTGRIYYCSEMSGEDDIPEELLESHCGVKIPHKNDLDLGRNLVIAFMESQAPADFDHIQDIFRRKGAYSRFKEFLESKGLLQKWYDFENDAQEKTIRDWCNANDIELDG